MVLLILVVILLSQVELSQVRAPFFVHDTAKKPDRGESVRLARRRSGPALAPSRRRCGRGVSWAEGIRFLGVEGRRQQLALICSSRASRMAPAHLVAKLSLRCFCQKLEHLLARSSMTRTSCRREVGSASSSWDSKMAASSSSSSSRGASIGRWCASCGRSSASVSSSGRPRFRGKWEARKNSAL